MKSKSIKKKSFGGKGTKKSKKFSIIDDPFFSHQSKKRRRLGAEDDDIVESGESDEDDELFNSQLYGRSEGAAEEEAELAAETADEKRLRVAKEYVEKIREIAKRQRDDEEEEVGERDEDEKGGERDSLVAQILQQEQLEESGQVRRAIAARVQKSETRDEFRLLVKHRQSVTAIALSEDDLKGFSASKDGTIIHWDVDSGKGEKYQWPSEEVLRSHGCKDPQCRAAKHSKKVLALAVSSDGRYLASGGLDRHVHLWDTRTQEHIQAFPGHRGPVSCLTFRLGTTELFSGSFDRTIKIWNAEDRTYINTLFGHQSEVLSIDCLRKERLLTVGRDRSMQLWKVPEESRLVFRAPASSLECGCFISNDEFLSGSDDGSIELWSLLRKKPVFIVKNAHTLLATHKNFERRDDGRTINGHIENEKCNPENKYCSSNSWISSVTVCRGSDLAASAAGDGAVRLWAVESKTKDIRPLVDLPLAGFVNSLAFAKSGRFLLAGVGQEPRLGRWGKCPTAQNGVALYSLSL
ncbi:U3 snoRNP-associated protein-like EMB2271 isoform X2 [Malania oleifera]|uniref:U3 snoRNP-associated protein-like EMB2271 isoform X2 n=1 Tax=Malania oleifera TaxID=397392 RepID=UPI0025ADAE02|nr:U3 snoRNP-associated protein-like EMB2271 isoform X2 [Malania oleifera]